MRIPIPLLLSSLGLVVACSDTTEPGGRPGQPPLAAAPALSDKGTGLLVVHETLHMDCVGEDVRFDAEVPLRFHTTVTPSGRTIYHDHLIPNSGVGTAVGQASGTVWTLDRVVSPFVTQSTDATDFAHFTATQFWVSETGPTMHLKTVFNLSENAQGEVTTQKFSFTCKLQ
jgi:hypothetical protein